MLWRPSAERHQSLRRLDHSRLLLFQRSGGELRGHGPDSSHFIVDVQTACFPAYIRAFPVTFWKKRDIAYLALSLKLLSATGKSMTIIASLRCW